jgi:hypothetical protein
MYKCRVYLGASQYIANWLSGRTPDKRIARVSYLNKHTPTMAAAVTLRLPWANMMRDKSMPFKLDYIIVFTIY